MITLKIPIKAPSSYFWYFYNCIDFIEKQKLAKIEYFPYTHKEKYVMNFSFNDKSVWLDLRDDNRLSPTYQNDNEAIILKSNYSSELWDNPPSTFNYKHQDWEYKIRSRVKPFILGRAFGEPYRNNNESSLQNNAFNPKFDVYSFSGTGLFNSVSLARLKIYSLFKNNYDLNFWLRIHGETISDEVKNEASNYPCPSTADDLKTYYKKLSNAKCSLNFPGICLSQPFRCVDAVIVNRAIISTKIWCDIYKSFPCIELPVCAYFGTGDWEKAQHIINNLDTFNYKEITQKARDWYSWFLSPIGMWKNQLLKQLC